MFSLYRLSFFSVIEQYGSDEVLHRSVNGFQLECFWSACLFLVICQHPLGYRSAKNKTWGLQWISWASSFPRKGRGCNASKRWHQLCPDLTFNRVTTWWWRRTGDKLIQYWFHSRKLDFRSRDGSCSICCALQPAEGSGFSLRWRRQLFGSKSKKHYRLDCGSSQHFE